VILDGGRREYEQQNQMGNLTVENRRLREALEIVKAILKEANDGEE